jgi:two-component system, NtrC family, response regulator AtoC
VGKELAARAIHRESRRSDGPFLAVNCAGVPENLLESEFFGHMKGAFSGATDDRPGLFQEASGGTLLLDEVGEMPPSLQATLLRVLQEGTIRPVGSDRTLEVDVRVIAATNRDLEEALAEGHFRTDLFYRLETFRIHLPPLRAREGDVDLLARHFVRRHAARLEREPPRPSGAFLEVLRRYPFPGNVRELENVVERAVTFCDGGGLEPRHLPDRIREWREGDGIVVGGSSGGESREVGPLEALLSGAAIPTLRELEGAWVRHVLEHTGGNKRRAAALLGVSRRTLYRKLEGTGDG